jgi:hypothetical protein
MNDLTAQEILNVNNINTNTQNMQFGNVIQNLIDGLNNTIVAGTPVNAVNATKNLAILGVVIGGETVIINNPAVEGTDVYEFLADAAQTKTAETNIAVNITAATTKSSGTLTVDTQPTSGNTMTIGTKVYTFVPVGTDTADGEVSIGADLAGAKVAIVKAINGTDDVNEAHPLVSAGTFVNNDCTITALIGGVSGDAIATEGTFTAVTNIFGGTALSGGADCTATNAVTALVASITDNDTQGVGAVDGEGDSVDLTADVAGTVGNAIVIGETMDNGEFTEGATLLSGGINGTLGTIDTIMTDATYLYKCVAANTTADKNWRRVSLGEAYYE